MDIFSQRTFLIRVIFLLVVFNLLTFGFSVWNCYHQPFLFPKNEAYKNMTGILKKELSLNDAQVNKLDDIRKRYYIKKIDLKKTIKAYKDEMNEEMFRKITDDAKVKTLAKKVAEGEYQMELLRYEQAKELKSICTPEQQEKFEKLVKEIRDYFRPDNQPKRR